MAPSQQNPSSTPKITKRYRRKKIKLFFNPNSGEAKSGLPTLEDILRMLNEYRFETDVFLIEPNCDLEGGIQKAFADGIDLFVACGGDGTASSVGRLLAGTNATLGIIPMGTQNNSAFAYGIPEDLAGAVRVLREGRKLNVDVGQVTVNKKTVNFVEILSVGLVTDLFQPADDFQHGNILKIGEFFRTLFAGKPADFEIKADSLTEPLKATGHVLLIANMPVVGAHFRLGKRSAMQDGKLDVMFFQDSSKLDLIAYMFQGMREGIVKDEKIKHILASEVSVKVSPSMAVMYDGVPFEEGHLEVSILKHALTMLIPKSSRVRQTT